MVLLEERAQRTARVFFFNDTATTEIYTLSLHDALPILMPSAYDAQRRLMVRLAALAVACALVQAVTGLEVALWVTPLFLLRSEEHTSELQSRQYIVCRLLLEKNKPRPRFSTA